MSFFSIENIFFSLWGYSVSYLEFGGIISGAIAVWLSARGNIWSWPIGLANVSLLFFLFFQVQLYPDMFLQIFFFVTNLIGWWRWSNPTALEADKRHELKISFTTPKDLLIFSFAGLAGTFLFGNFASHLHQLVPVIFNKPSAFPYIDSFVTVMSIVATYLMVQKKVECWIIWILVDATATVMYFIKEIRFLSVEYLVFCFLAAYGLHTWLKEKRSYKNQVVDT